MIKINSNRGLVCFDSDVIWQGTGQQYITAAECLTAHFLDLGWLTSSQKSSAVVQYSLSMTKFRAFGVMFLEDGFRSWLSTTNYSAVLSYINCSSAQVYVDFLVEVRILFAIPIPELGSDEEVFRYFAGTVQICFTTLPNVSSLYRDRRSSSRVLRLLGREKELLQYCRFSI